MSQTEQPIEFFYKVTETFFAGEYPFSLLLEDGIVKLKRLIDFGITHFIDLTSEQPTRYSEFLPNHCTYLNLPTEDYILPSFENLKTAHDFISQSKEKIYLHCIGGYDRTGVAVATFFVYQGKTVAEAKQLYLQKADKIRTRYRHLPLLETKWEVLEEYEQFLQHNP